MRARSQPLFGGHGGDTRAAQVAQVAGAVKLRMMPTMPGLTLTEAVIRGARLRAPILIWLPKAGPVAQAFAERAAAGRLTTRGRSVPIGG